MAHHIFSIALVIHIVCGTLGLISGTIVSMTKKGNQFHRRTGIIFAISMIGSGLCSLVLATLHRNDFLLCVGIFTLYLTCSGWRYLFLKNIPSGQQPSRKDWLLLLLMLPGTLLFFVIGIRSVLEKQYFGIIILLFAFRSLWFIFQDIRTFKGKIKIKNYWLIFHLQRMMGAYIAALTAFAVVNAPERLSFIPWLLPAVIFAPVIVVWTKRYRQQ